MIIPSELFIGGPFARHVVYNASQKMNANMTDIAGVENEVEEIRKLNFGIGAKTGEGIRAGLLDVMPSPNDKSMQGRLHCAIAKWLGSSIVSNLNSCNEIPFINNFSFTPEQDFKKIFKTQFTISQPQENLITVCMDKFVPRSAIAVPAGTTDVELVISVAGCMLRGGTPIGSKTITILIPFNESLIPSYLLKFPIHMPAGSLTVTAARVIYYNRKQNILSKITESDDNPGAILNARYFF